MFLSYIYNNILLTMKTFYVEGNIGSGKSTFCKWIENNFNNFSNVIYEPVDEWKKTTDNKSNNLLDYFYKDPIRWAYTFQTMTLSSRIKSLDSYTNKNIRFVDRSIYCDKNVFAKNCYENGIFTDIEWKLYLDLFKSISNNFKFKPTAFIYIKTSPETCLKRIQKRNRNEEKNISLEYLKQIHQKHEQWLNNDDFYIPIIVIDEMLLDYQDEKKMNIIINIINDLIYFNQV